MAVAQSKHPGGRPTKFEPWMLRVSRKLYELGATDEQAAEALDITVETIHKWNEKRPEFAEARKSKEFSDIEVERSLFQRAKGYDHNGVHVPAHPTSQIFWLKNRKPKVWRDKTDVEHSGAVSSRTPAEELEHLVQKASAHPTQAVVIRAWAKELLSRIPEVEGE